MPDLDARKRIASTLAATAELVSAPRSEQLYEDLVRHAGQTLGLDHVHIARLLPGNARVETLATWSPDGPIPNWTYALANTPCGEVIGKQRRSIEQGVRACYPDDPDLKRLCAEGYVGEPILDSSGEVMGIMAGITFAPLRDIELIQANLRILAARTGAEFEQRQAMELLRQERDTLSNILETVETMIVALDTEGRIRLINRKGCQLLGYGAHELIGQDWITHCLPSDLDHSTVRKVYRCATNGDMGGYEYHENPVITRSGEIRLIAWHNSAYRGTGGQVIGTLSSGVDITEQRAVERKLLESELQFRALANAGQALIWAAGANRSCHYFNQVWHDFTGWKLDQLQGDGWMLLVHPEDLPACLAAYNGAFDRCERFSMTYRLRRHDGEYRWLQDDGSPRFDSTGQFVGYIGFCLDITPARIAQAALAQQQERLRLILDHAPIGIWLLSPSGRLEFVNRAFCEATGIPESRYLAVRYYADLLPEPYATQCAISDTRALSEPGVVIVHEQLPFADGQIHDLRVIKFAKRNAQGEPQALIGLCLDITEERRKECALRESEAKLQTMMDWTHDWEYWSLPDGRFNYMSPAAERVTGYSVDDFQNDPALIDAIVHPEDRALWQAHVSSHARVRQGAQETIAELDFRLLRKDGTTLWVNHRCGPVFDTDGAHQGVCVTVSDINARKAAEEQIRNLAYFDPLTGLPNRRLLLDRLDQALISSARSQRHGALLMLDLDNFKTLNDTQGHDVGDRLLCDVAARIRATLREQDTVARMGGDEYLVILEALDTDKQTAANEAERVAEKVRTALNAPYEIVSAELDHYCTPSIGVSLFRGHGNSPKGLLKQADVALYQAKGDGRNAVRFFSPEMQTNIEERMHLETALRNAPNRDELLLHYQPQTNQTGRCIGVEALLRWQRPEHGLVAPMRFIPLAEETGLILPIGHWVLRMACAQLQSWEASEQWRHIQLAINVSARQFHQNDFICQIKDCLGYSGANPERLILELTESAFLENADDVGERMRALKALGVRFSLDDFGTGYSSLSYLKRLPFDQLKIDKTFVRNITTDPSDAAIVTAILAMSSSLGLEIIAEGVETEAQRDFLLANGCHGFQGHLFGHPAPIQDLQGDFLK